MARDLRRLLLLLAGVLVVAVASALYREYRIEVEQGVTVPLHAINSACLIYAQTYPNIGFPHKLSQLGSAADARELTGPENSGLIDNQLASGVKSGYVYTYKPGLPDRAGKITTYCFTAVPGEYANRRRSYYSDQTGVIHFTDANRTPTADDPELTRF